ncbi:allergen Tha p 1-like [Melitaea cinxia]|uniref:allergen Tha p 1-like n=1 Tax=Melitaea cinxia TaxID=113334 RepID=UPI000645386E|nr:allergen Tha p 1-like [Melitaea cinxia]
MKTIVILATVLAAVLAYPADTYNPRYDNFDAEELVSNKRVLESYGKCFLDKGPCTAEGNDFKKVIPEALRTSCAKCSPKQRQLVRIVINGFKTKTPELWEELKNKEDPHGEYRETFEKFINASD